MDPLCHYTRAEAALEHIIPSGNLHMRPYARMRDPLENHELTFSGSLPLDGRPEELLLEELTALMDDARSGSAGSEIGCCCSPSTRRWATATDEPRVTAPTGTVLGACSRSKYVIETRWVARA